MANKKNKEQYNAKNINVLKGLDAVRKRPAMYIGDVSSRGLHHLVNEVVDNSIDESLAGYCDKIEIKIRKNGSIAIQDNGRGIPVDIHPEEKRSALEVVMTVLHAGGKFDKSSYKVSGGLHGVGVSVVNALAEWLKVEVRRDGKVHFQEFKRGVPLAKVKTIGKARKNESGTNISFFPDSEIFKTTEFKFSTLAERMRELAYLNRTITINIKDE
jgi:DNA gyrase subunit B